MSQAFLAGNQRLKIKKRSFSEWLALFVFFFQFSFGLLFEVFYIPSALKYLIDVSLIAFLFIFGFKRQLMINRKISPLVTIVVLFFVYTLIVYCFNFQSPFYYIWGVRNNFRFYIAFFAFAMCINSETADGVLKCLDILFWINFIVSILQYIFLDIHPDHLGGIFGTWGVTNAYTLIFFMIVISKSLLQTFNGREKVWKCILKCAASILVAAMAEMKFYFVIFVILLVLTSLITKLSRRKFVIVIISSIIVMLGSLLLVYFFEEFDGFFSIKSIWKLATQEHYSSTKDINRLSAIFVLMKNYITNPLQQIFGMGLGNCDLSDVSIFNSVFYQKYSFLHYSWFSSAMMFLETGFIGMAIYLSFFAVCFVSALRQLKKGTGNRLFCQMTIVMSVMSLALFLYNSSLRVESGYMVYFVLALPFISSFQDDLKVIN